jgi:hypothetical protein
MENTTQNELFPGWDSFLAEINEATERRIQKQAVNDALEALKTFASSDEKKRGWICMALLGASKEGELFPVLTANAELIPEAVVKRVFTAAYESEAGRTFIKAESSRLQQVMRRLILDEATTQFPQEAKFDLIRLVTLLEKGGDGNIGFILSLLKAVHGRFRHIPDILWDKYRGEILGKDMGVRKDTRAHVAERDRLNPRPQIQKRTSDRRQDDGNTPKKFKGVMAAKLLAALEEETAETQPKTAAASV